MEAKLGKGKMVLFLIALFLTNVAVMSDMVIIPAIANMYGVFGDSINLVNFIISGPALIVVFSSLLCGKLMQYFSKKTLLIFSYALFAAASILGVAIENALYMAVMRGIVGFAMGIVNVSAVALIPEIFLDEKKRSTILGMYNSAMAAVGAVIGLIAGYFAVAAWQFVFRVYWISVPILAMIILFVPKTPPESVVFNEDGSVTKKEALPLLSFGALVVGFILFNMIYMVIYFQISVYVLENAIGNESVAGILSSLGTVGSAVACLAFGLTYTKFKRATIIPSYLAWVLCFSLLYLKPTFAVAVFACTLMGAAYGNGFSYYFMRTTVIVPPSRISLAMGIVTAANGVGMFLSPYFATTLQQWMGVQSLTAIMPVLIILCAAGSVLSIVLTLRDKKYPTEYSLLKEAA
ncbi:MFS transporter [Alkalibacter rhizosphaerae]|uniref:MFS transporter n=1 Tax=Alkalibacter rhizosphaerae TaxID=2815577 RepID=A0A975AGK9_9FIRM|nr:MFS transporter [Alkalibacter rhizosphaerae]QSX07654.1 MFS transporter [Alkalibacter rhizosphaerae]